jgi:hypothetical protein
MGVKPRLATPFVLALIPFVLLSGPEVVGPLNVRTGLGGADIAAS